MNLNPYEEAATSAGFQQPQEWTGPSKRIEWNKIALCYAMTFVGQILLSVIVGLVFGIIAFTMPASIDGIIESSEFIVGIYVLFKSPLILSVVWLTSKVRSRNFLHAAIFAAVNVCLDSALVIALSNSYSWQEVATILGKAGIVVITAAFTLLIRQKSRMGMA